MVEVDDEKVSQFMAFTGSADASKAASYLEMSGGNLETAVGLFMEHESGAVGGGMAAAAGGAHGDDYQVRAPDATQRMRLMDESGPNMMMGGGGGYHPMLGSGAAHAGALAGMLADPSFQMMNAMMEDQLRQTAFAVPPADPRAAINEAVARQAAAQRQRRPPARYGNDDDDDDDDDHIMYESDEDYAANVAAAAAAHHDSDDDVQVLGDDAAAASSLSAAPPVPPRLSDMFAAPEHLIRSGAKQFAAARVMAKDSKRWLLVNLQRDSEFASHALNRDVWRDELVENLITAGFVFWQQFDSHPEGRTYVERYQVREFPHIGIIDPRTGRLLFRKEGWTQENALRAEDFAQFVMDFCDRNSMDKPPQAPRSRDNPPSSAPGSGGGSRSTAMKRPVESMSEEEQLQAAMRASMHDVDGDGGGNTDDDDDEVQILENGGEDRKPAAMAAAAAPAVTNANQAYLDVDVGAEPAVGPRLQLKMPDGKRVVRRFDKDSSVQTLYAFVAQSLGEAKEGKQFVLMAGFPPADLSIDMDRTIDECKLAGQAIAVRWMD